MLQLTWYVNEIPSFVFTYKIPLLPLNMLLKSLHFLYEYLSSWCNSLFSLKCDLRTTFISFIFFVSCLNLV